jgi:hypothetical protein
MGGFIMGQPSVNWIKNYSNDLAQLLQKQGSVLRNTVDVDPNFTGEYKFYDQLGATTVNERTSRFEDTIINNADHNRRRVSKTLYTSGMLFDDWDAVNMALDPSSSYAQSEIMAMGRKIDSLVRTAATGTAYTGKDGSTATSFDSNMSIAGGSASLTLAKIIQAYELLSTENNNTREEKYFVVHPKQVTTMLNNSIITSADYNMVKPLMNGEIVKFMGFNFVVDTDLDVSSDVYTCIAYVKSGIKLAVSRDISVSVANRADKNDAKQILSKMAMGAVRMEEGKVVRIYCDES